MPIKAKQVSAEQAALVAKGFVSRDDRTSHRRGEKNYFYTGEVRENERMEQELSSSDSNSSFTSSVASASSPPMPGKSKGKSSASSMKKENGGGSFGSTFLTRGGAENLASDVDSDEEALAEARRKTQQFLFPEREKNYKPPPRQVNQRLVEYEKTKRAAKIRREQEKEEAALLEQQQQQQGSVVPEQPYTPPPPTHDRAPAHGRMAEEATSPAVKETTVTVDRETAAVTNGDEPPKRTVTGPSSSSHTENRARPRVDRSGSSSSAGAAENPDFERLLQLFGEDILAERREREEEEARDRQQREYAKTARGAPRTSSSFKDDLGDLEARPRELYHRPANTFAELQDDALHRLYETWGNEDYDEGADDRPQFFVATDHLGEAFTMAATKIVSDRSTSAPAGLHSSSAITSNRVGDRAFSMEEVAALQAAQRNERRLRETGHSSLLPGGGYSADPEVLIADAQAKLDRYLDSVRWLEQLVRDGRFMSSVGQFLHQHHNTFLHHVSESSSVLVNTKKKAATASSIKSFSHEEYKIFTEFSNRIAKVVFQVLSSKVKDFDEAEFAENLFDTPVGRDSSARLGYDVGPMNVVSYPAWRIMLSISNFESFVDWMTDYIREEYNIDDEPVSVAGPRGLRALIESTYRYKPPNGGGGGSGGDGAALPEDNAEEDSAVLLEGEAAGARRNGKGIDHPISSSTRPPANEGSSPVQQQPRLRGNSTTKDMDSTPMRKPSNSSGLGIVVQGSSPQPSSPSTTGSVLVHTTENRNGSAGSSSSPLLPLPLPTPPSSAGGSVSSIPPPTTITGATPASYTSARGASTVALVKKFGKPKKQPRDLPPISHTGSLSTDRSGKHPLGSQRSVDSADLPSVTHPSSAPTGTGAKTTVKGKPNRLGHAESPRAESRPTKRGASNSRPNVEAPPRRNPSVKKKKGPK